MEQNAEEQQMQNSGRGGVLRASRGCCYWFAYRFDVCWLFSGGFRDFLRQDSRGLLLICNVI
jgi:hypothetical protein